MNDYHGEIETIHDWNEALGKCGCVCYMPTCLEPILIGQVQTLGMGGFQGPPIFLPDTPEDSDSKSEEITPFYRVHQTGCRVNGRSIKKGPQGILLLQVEANYEISTTRAFPHVWDIYPFAFFSDEVVVSVAAGNISIKEFGHWAFDEDDTPSDSNPPPIIGPFLSYTAVLTLENYAGQPDPLWLPSASEDESDRPILGPEAQPYWRRVAITYEKTYGTNGKLNGSKPSVDSNTESDGEVRNLFKAAGCNALPEESGSESMNESVEFIDLYENRIDCDTAKSELRNLDHIKWPTDAPNDSESYEGYDLNSLTKAGSGAFFRCDNYSNQRAEATRNRYRWIVPPCHGGSYYRIDWQEVFFPQEYLDWYIEAQKNVTSDLTDVDGILPFDPNANPPPVMPKTTNKSWVWRGTALGDCPLYDSNYSDSVDSVQKEYQRRYNMPSRRSPWSQDMVATAQGVIEILNVRIQCCDNPFGNASQPVFLNGEWDEDDVDQDGIPDSQEPISK